MRPRRKLLLALGAGALAAPLRPFAQQPAAGMHRIGFLGATSAAGLGNRLEALRAGLRELGYVEGKNLVIEFRWAESRYARLAELAAELVRLNVALIVTHSTPGVLAAKQATMTIPIIIAAQGDAVATGVVTSLARPGGNITGSTFFSPLLAAKGIELLKEVLPKMQRYGYLSNPDTSSIAQAALQEMGVTARALKVELQAFEVRGAEEFERVFAQMEKQGVTAIGVQSDPMLTANIKLVAAIAVRRRIAAIGDTAFADAGGLLGYGPDFPVLFRRAAVYVDKILKGVKPGELPIEQSTRFDMVVNLRTATTLGLKIPQSTFLRATRLIE